MGNYIFRERLMYVQISCHVSVMASKKRVVQIRAFEPVSFDVNRFRTKALEYGPQLLEMQKVSPRSISEENGILTGKCGAMLASSVIYHFSIAVSSCF